MSIWDYFDIPVENRDEISEGDSLSSSCSSKQNIELNIDDSIIEFTVNAPPNKDYTEKQYNNLIDKLKLLIPEKCPLDKSSLNYYLEKCKSGKIHLHGMIKLKKERFYIEGVLQEFVKMLLSSIDKRLNMNFDKNYYSTLSRYRTPTVCVQYTDNPERIAYWGQYITKDCV